MSVFKKLIKLKIEAKEYGFYWQDHKSIIDQIKSEIIEIEALLQNNNHSNEHLQEEIGDLLHAAFSLCLYCNFDPKQTLANSSSKFFHRFDKVKNIAKQEGQKNLKNKSPEELMHYWQQAKN